MFKIPTDRREPQLSYFTKAAKRNNDLLERGKRFRFFSSSLMLNIKAPLHTTRAGEIGKRSFISTVGHTVHTD